MLEGGEIIIILLIALLVFGPKRLPELAQKLGRWTAELRAAASDVRRSIEAEVSELKGVSDDLKATGEEISGPLRAAKDDLDQVAGGGHEWTGPKPISGPTPADAMADLEEIQRAAAKETTNPQSGFDIAAGEDAVDDEDGA